MVCASRSTSTRAAATYTGFDLEGRNRDDGYNREQEAYDQPLVLLQGNQVIKKVRLSRQLIPTRHRSCGN